MSSPVVAAIETSRWRRRRRSLARWPCRATSSHRTDWRAPRAPGYRAASLEDGSEGGRGSHRAAAHGAIAGASAVVLSFLFPLQQQTFEDMVTTQRDASPGMIRPWQADPAITLVPAVGRPNHPSYPSAHSCFSSSGAEVLGAFFPEERTRLDSLVTEAGLSRMYGGIHYRFDVKAGKTARG